VAGHTWESVVIKPLLHLLRSCPLEATDLVAIDGLEGSSLSSLEASSIACLASLELCILALQEVHYLPNPRVKEVLYRENELTSSYCCFASCQRDL
jgi:hypothetical protein